MTDISSVSTDAETPNLLPELEIELTEVKLPPGPPALPVLAIAGVCALFVAYALYSALTGALGVPALLLLVLGGGGLSYVYKQIKDAQAGELKALRNKISSGGRGGGTPVPSVRVVGTMLDI